MAEHSRKNNQAVVNMEQAQREAELEEQLFGRHVGLEELGREREAAEAAGDLGSSLSAFLRSYANGPAAADGGDGGPILVEDRQGAAQQGEEAQAPSARRRKRPVWEDPQDANLRVNVAERSQLRKLRHADTEVELSGEQFEQRLRQQHAKLHPQTAWASLKSKRKQHATDAAADGDEDAAVERLLQRAGGLLARGAALPPSVLETTRLKDANQADPCKGAVKSVDFHQGGQLMLTASLDKRVRLFNVDGVKNPRATSWVLEDMPVHKAAFSSGGTQVVASGRRRFFYVLDVESQAAERITSLRAWRDEKSFESFVTSQHSMQPLVAFFGNEGHVPLVSLHTKQMIGTLKMNGTARTGAFAADGNQLLTSGGDGTVYVWDLRTQRCLQRYQDEGCINSTSMECSPDGALFATGSSSGVVNIYSRMQQQVQEQLQSKSSKGSWVMPEAPMAAKPLKTVLNLTTAIDTLCYNHDSQLLLLASRLKRDALKLLHVPTLTVFSNWPTSKSPLHYVHSAAFSPNSGYMAIGNARGRVLLYRLHHYGTA